MSEQQKVFLITGTSSGLGLSLARAVLALGHKVVATMRNPSKSPLIVAEIESSPNGVVKRLDVTSPDLEAQVLRFGHIDVLINNAGYGFGGALEDSSLEEARRLFETLYWGPIRLMKALIPQFRQQGSGTVINVTSTEGISAQPGLTFYCSAKHALEGASEALSQELAPFGIRVLIAQPGGMRTEFLNPQSTEEATMSEAYKGGPVDYVSQIMRGMHGTQNLDPDRCAKRIVEAVVGCGEGWPEEREKLLRLPLGKEFLGRIDAKMQMVKANMVAMEAVAKSCDFDE